MLLRLSHSQETANITLFLIGMHKPLTRIVHLLSHLLFHPWSQGNPLCSLCHPVLIPPATHPSLWSLVRTSPLWLFHSPSRISTWMIRIAAPLRARTRNSRSSSVTTSTKNMFAPNGPSVLLATRRARLSQGERAVEEERPLCRASDTEAEDSKD